MSEHRPPVEILEPDGFDTAPISAADVASAGRSCQAIILIMLALAAIICVAVAIAVAI